MLPPLRGVLLVLLLATSVPVMATHIVGGELYYTWQGNNTYLVTLKVYRDCGPTNENGTGFDNQASVGVFHSNGNFVTNLPMNLFNAEVELVPVALENPCFIVPPDVCVESAVYQEILVLPPTAGGYILCYERCCRNPSIINIVNPQSSGATFTCRIPGTNQTTEPNSSPVFVNFPPPALCIGAEFYFDHMAEDPDGDQLVYSFCTPLLGASPENPAPQPPNGPPFQNVQWAPGFSAGYPVTSNPALTIDPATGYMTGTPTQLGQYVIGVCVSEYRNGILINTINRDFQVNVTLCDPSIVAVIPAQANFCSGFEVSFTNQSVNAEFFHWDFGVPDTDTDTSNVSNPTFVYPEGGLYTVTLVANPGWSCADTSTTQYEVFPPIEPDIVVNGGECVNDQVQYNFTYTAAVSASAIVNWNFGAGSSPSTSSQNFPTGVVLNEEASQHTVTLTITDNGCTESDTEIIDNPPEPMASIAEQETFCDGLTYTFQSEATNAASWYWDFDTPLNGDNSVLENPTFTFPDTGQYVIMHIAAAPFTCPDTALMLFRIYGDLNPFFEGLDPQCLSTNSFDLLGMGATTSDAQYSWSFGDGSSAGSQAPQNVQYDTAGTFPVTLTIAENGCTENYTDEVWVVADPELSVDLQQVAGCPALYVDFEATAVAETQVLYYWEFGDGEFSYLQNPTHTYANPGSYQVTLTASTTNGCITTIVREFPQAVIVYSLPQPGFTLEPQTVDILNPVVQVTNASGESNICSYFTSDGGSIDGCDGEYAFTEAGWQTITQVVTNEFGCTASTTGTVSVSGFLFWAPNSFTPGTDGLNDAWRPVTTGITQYTCVIRDRWGTVVFETSDPDAYWYGQLRGGEHYAESGVFLYEITVNDLLGFPHAFHGHIALIR